MSQFPQFSQFLQLRESPVGLPPIWHSQALILAIPSDLSSGLQNGQILSSVIFSSPRCNAFLRFSQFSSLIPAAAAAVAAAVHALQLFQNRIHFPLFLAVFSAPKVTVAPGIEGLALELSEYFGLMPNRSHGILETPFEGRGTSD